MKPARLFSIVCACLTACAALAQQGAAPVTAPDEEDVPEQEEVWDFDNGRGADPAIMGRLNIMVPVGGRPHEGLSYRIYGERTPEKGTRLAALFESKRVTRMDETHLLFEEAVYSSFDDPKTPETPTRTVKFKTAIYNLQDRLVYSNEPLTIEDRKTKIRCGGILYDLVTGITVYSGGVELSFDPEEEESAEESPAVTPAPVSEPKK